MTLSRGIVRDGVPALLRRRWGWVRYGILPVFVAALALASAAGVWSIRLPLFEVFGDLQGHFAALAAAAVALGLMLRAPLWVTGLATAVVAGNLTVIGLRLGPVETCTAQVAATGQRVLRLMTLNIQDSNRDFAAVERAVAGSRPDILLFQEIRPAHMPLLNRLHARYPNQILCDVHPDCGIAVLSAFPLEPLRKITDGAIMLVEAEVRIGDRDLILLTTHVQRPYRGQTPQFRVLTEQVMAMPDNSVVAGDFNSALWSENLSRYVQSTGVCACNATHATWPNWLGPLGVPIDHVFLKKGVRLLGIAAVPDTGSDHRGLIASIGLL